MILTGWFAVKDFGNNYEQKRNNGTDERSRLCENTQPQKSLASFVAQDWGDCHLGESKDARHENPGCYLQRNV